MLSLLLLGLPLIPLAASLTARAPEAAPAPTAAPQSFRTLGGSLSESGEQGSCTWFASTTQILWIPGGLASTTTVTAATRVYYWNSIMNSTQTSIKQDDSVPIPSGYRQLQYNADGTQVTTATFGTVTTVVAYPTEYVAMGHQYAFGSGPGVDEVYTTSNFPSQATYPASQESNNRDPKGTAMQPLITTIRDKNTAFYQSNFPDIKVFSTCGPYDGGFHPEIMPEIDVLADPVVVFVTAESLEWIDKRTNAGPRRSAAPRPVAEPAAEPATQTQPAAQTMLSKVVNLGSTTVTVTGAGTTIGTGPDALTIALSSAPSAVASTQTSSMSMSAATTTPMASPPMVSPPPVSNNSSGNGTTKHLTPVIKTYLSSMTLGGGAGSNSSATLTGSSGPQSSAAATTSKKSGASALRVAAQAWESSCVLGASFLVAVLAAAHAL